MPTHLYCLTSSHAEGAPDGGGVGDLVGFGGRPVRELALDHGLVAWVGSVDAPHLPRDDALVSLVQLHDVVNRKALDAGAVLPALLGDPYETDDELRTALGARAAEIDRLWARARLHVEMSMVFAVDTDADAIPATGRDRGGADPGRRYLESVKQGDPALARADDLERFARRTAESVAALAVAALPQGSPHEGRMSLTHLIARTDVDRYLSLARDTGVPDGLRFALDGPRPTYRFAHLSRRPAAGAA